MSNRILRLCLSFALLLILLAAEVGASFLPIARSLRPLLIVPGALMAAVVALSFMELGREPEPARLFAVSALLWLAILLGLGSVDAVTRTVYPTEIDSRVVRTTNGGLRSNWILGYQYFR